jgi:hypothetical protein
MLSDRLDAIAVSGAVQATTMKTMPGTPIAPRLSVAAFVAVDGR